MRDGDEEVRGGFFVTPADVEEAATGRGPLISVEEEEWWGDTFDGRMSAGLVTGVRLTEGVCLPRRAIPACI